MNTNTPNHIRDARPRLDDAAARRLLALYYDGATQPTDERQLAAYFASGDVPADLEADRAAFVATVDDARDLRLEAMIARMEAQETPTAQMTLRRPWRTRVMAIAASVAAIVAVGIAIRASFGDTLSDGDANDAVFADTCSSPEEAELHLRRALAIVGRQTHSVMVQLDAASSTSSRRVATRHITFE